jgi:hypothetical protein
MPYAPGVTNKGGDYIMQAVLLASKAIADGMADKGKQWDEQENAEALHAAYPSLYPQETWRQNAMGQKVPAWDTLTPQAKVALTKSIPMIYGMKQADAEQGWKADASARAWAGQAEEERYHKDLANKWNANKPDPSAPLVVKEVPGGGRMINGRFVNDRPAKPMDAADAATLQAATTQLQQLNSEIAEHQNQIAQGDHRYGFLNIHNRADRVSELMAQKQGLETKIKAMSGATPTPSSKSSSPAPAKPGAKAVEPPLPAGGAGGLNLTDTPAPKIDAPPGQPTPTPGYRIPVPTPRPVTSANPKTPLTDAQARDIMQQAGGDPAKARELARAAGFEF